MKAELVLPLVVLGVPGVGGALQEELLGLGADALDGVRGDLEVFPSFEEVPAPGTDLLVEDFPADVLVQEPLLGLSNGGCAVVLGRLVD